MHVCGQRSVVLAPCRSHVLIGGGESGLAPAGVFKFQERTICSSGGSHVRPLVLPAAGRVISGYAPPSRLAHVSAAPSMASHSPSLITPRPIGTPQQTPRGFQVRTSQCERSSSLSRSLPRDSRFDDNVASGIKNLHAGSRGVPEASPARSLPYRVGASASMSRASLKCNPGVMTTPRTSPERRCVPQSVVVVASPRGTSHRDISCGNHGRRNSLPLWASSASHLQPAPAAGAAPPPLLHASTEHQRVPSTPTLVVRARAVSADGEHRKLHFAACVGGGASQRSSVNSCVYQPSNCKPGLAEFTRGQEIKMVQIELQPGAEISIGDCELEVLAAIGEGSFGVVWGARCHKDGKHIAVKEIRCKTESAVREAMNEAHILAELGGTWRNVKNRIPSFVACSTERYPNDWRVRVAMDKLDGESLNRHVERLCKDGAWFRLPPRERFQVAATYATELVAQLAETFSSISAIAYHRDVNPRNILVDEKSGRLSYRLIDFGLAVDALRWRSGAEQTQTGDSVTGAWQVFGVGGDCRYWPVSAWLMLEQGPKALVASPQLCLEYKMHLDLHSLGISALQVMAEIFLGEHVEHPERGSACNDIDFPHVSGKLSILWVAWSRYWRASTHFWRRLFDAYRESGDGSDLKAIKAAYRTSNVHEQIAEHLRDVRVALREVCDVCERAPSNTGLECVPSLFHALMAMISSGEDSGRCSWRRVELLVGGGAADVLRSPQKSSVLVPAVSSATPITVSPDSAASASNSDASTTPPLEALWSPPLPIRNDVARSVEIRCN